MATKEQYEFFRNLSAEEDARYNDLDERAKFYLGIVTVFLAAILLKAPEVQTSAVALKVPWWLILIEALLLAISLLFIVLGTLIRTYEGVADPEQIVNDYGGGTPPAREICTAIHAGHSHARRRH